MWMAWRNKGETAERWGKRSAGDRPCTTMGGTLNFIIHGIIRSHQRVKPGGYWYITLFQFQKYNTSAAVDNGLQGWAVLWRRKDLLENYCSGPGKKKKKKDGGLKQGEWNGKWQSWDSHNAPVWLQKCVLFHYFTLPLTLSDPSQFGDNSGVSSVDACQVTKKFLLQQYINVTSLALVWGVSIRSVWEIAMKTVS